MSYVRTTTKKKRVQNIVDLAQLPFQEFNKPPFKRKENAFNFWGGTLFKEELRKKILKKICKISIY